MVNRHLGIPNSPACGRDKEATENKNYSVIIFNSAINLSSISPFIKPIPTYN
jgi:hypothetical protein